MSQINLFRQTGKAVRDIEKSLNESKFDKAKLQLDLLNELLDAPKSRRRSWSFYTPRIAEEFGE
jgi:hypothetical protein